jgi:transposase
MRYAQGGGLTAERRRSRERIRNEAGERFGRGERTAVIAKDLRVSERSVERWRRAWREGGLAALASSGPPKLPKLSDGQFAELEGELALGPAVHGWEDQRWTLERIRELIAREVPIGLLVGGGVAADAPARLVLAVSRPPGA